MKTRWKPIAEGTVAALLALLPLASPRLDVAAQSNSPTPAYRLILTSADAEKMMQSLSNWGRWGSTDQLGTLNLITPAIRKAAAQLVRDGVAISLAHDVIKTPVENSHPFIQQMIKSGQTPGSDSAEDSYCVRYHGFTQTHMDSLCHVFHKGRMYNGYSQAEVTDAGAQKLSVIEFKNGIFTRGVILDFPQLFGLTYLKGEAIYPKDLDEWEKRTGVHIQSGDAVFIRTGRWARRRAEGDWDFMQGSAGLDVTCMPWFKKRDVALMGSDLALDVMPSRVEGIALPVHMITIIGLGTPILDNLDLEAVAKKAAQRHRPYFLFTVAPLPVDGGTGSPVNPTAVF
jgi:kynurenine formamidase